MAPRVRCRGCCGANPARHHPRHIFRGDRDPLGTFGCPGGAAARLCANGSHEGIESGRRPLKHTLPNASIPVITVLGLQVGTLLGGAIITEQVFAYPGMGRLALQAIGNRDMPVVQAFVVVTAAIIAATNLAVDVCYSLLDPRIRYT